MVKALGYASVSFDLSRPGRLCRGRERWVAAMELEEPVQLHRLVISGAEFTDDTARDAQRGLTFSGLTPGQVLKALFPDQPLLAFCEEGRPFSSPEDALSREDYDQQRNGGRRVDWCVRWRAVVNTAEEIDALMGGATSSVDGFVPWNGELTDDLDRALFTLTGHGQTVRTPVARFQPTAIPIVLEQVDALVCVHLDKHGPVIALYSHAPYEAQDALENLAKAHETLAVPFAIPPMLARWDRALYDLRARWNEDELGAFPVPVGEEVQPRWSNPDARTPQETEAQEDPVETAEATDVEQEAAPETDETGGDTQEATPETSEPTDADQEAAPVTEEPNA